MNPDPRPLDEPHPNEAAGQPGDPHDTPTLDPNTAGPAWATKLPQDLVATAAGQVVRAILA